MAGSVPSNIRDATPTMQQEQVLRACLECNGIVRVKWGFVPPLAVLYLKLGHNRPDPRFPLTHGEVLSQEICGSSVDKKKYRQLYSTMGTLNLMDRWRTAVAQWQQEKQRQREENQRLLKLQRTQTFAGRLYGSKLPRPEKSHINFTPPPAKPFVNETFEKMATLELEGPNKKHRTRTRPLKGPKSTIKRYGNEPCLAVSGVPKKKGKKKQTERSQAQNRKNH